MESPRKVAYETARALSRRPDVLVAACAKMYLDEANVAIEELAKIIEPAMRRCMCKDYPKGD